MFMRLFITSIALFYLAAVSGVAVNLHYCMGKIASISLMHEKDHDDGNCNKCGMDKTTNHCCKDDVIVFKVNETHKPSYTSLLVAGISEAGTGQTVDLTTAEQGIAGAFPVFYNAPPPAVSNKVYRLVEVFLI